MDVRLSICTGRALPLTIQLTWKQALCKKDQHHTLVSMPSYVGFVKGAYVRPDLRGALYMMRVS